MIKIKRPKKGPPCLTGPTSLGTVELNAAKIHYAGGPAAAYPFTVYGRPEVKLALEAMSYDKCAYCESDYGAVYDGAVEHYRPKGKMHPDPHPGYWWLAATWTNLLPSCQHCNESRSHVIVTPNMTMTEAARLHRKAQSLTSAGKASQFPVRGRRKLPYSKALSSEDPLIIDPTRRDPTDHICFPPELGVSLATPTKTPNGPDLYGLTTINVTALNRYDVVRARSQVLMDLRKSVLTLAKALDAEDEAVRAGNLFAKKVARDTASDAIQAIKARANPKRPYSAVAVWLLARLDTWLDSERAQGIKLDIPAIDGL